MTQCGKMRPMETSELPDFPILGRWQLSRRHGEEKKFELDSVVVASSRFVDGRGHSVRWRGAGINSAAGHPFGVAALWQSAVDHGLHAWGFGRIAVGDSRGGEAQFTENA